MFLTAGTTRTVTLTLVAMLAFAGNSLLCRLALKDNAIDPGSYTLIRIIAGAMFLAGVVMVKQRDRQFLAVIRSGNWPAAFALFAYAATLSFGYISIDTGTGALVLFGFVQISMIVIGLFRGNHLSLIEWSGVAMAFAGLTYLLMPGTYAPDFMGFTLMAFSGAAWGIYTLIGRGSAQPLVDTTGNFIRACVPALALGAILAHQMYFTTEGLLLAIASGALTSGAGYAIWYAVVGHLRVSQAAVVQLSVPVIAAAGGALFASEPITMRFTLAASVVLGGIFLVLLNRSQTR